MLSQTQTEPICRDRPGLTCPRCYRRHQSWPAVLKCKLGARMFSWISGNPDPSGCCYVSLSRCGSYGSGPEWTGVLYATYQEAQKAKDFIDRIGCGGRCNQRHEVYILSGQAATADEVA